MFDVDGLLERQDGRGRVRRRSSRDPHIWYGDLDPSDIDRDARVQRLRGASSCAQHPRPARRARDRHAVARRRPRRARPSERCASSASPGIAMPTSDGGRYLDAVPDAFWELVAGLDVPVFIHPGGTVVGQELMTMYRLGEVCGRPLDTTRDAGAASSSRARSSVIPASGSSARTRAARSARSPTGSTSATSSASYAPLGPWGEVELPEPPSAYVARLYLDTVTYGTAGAPARARARRARQRVLYGSDRPPVPFDARAHARLRARARPPGRGRGGASSAATRGALFATRMSRWRRAGRRACDASR